MVRVLRMAVVAGQEEGIVQQCVMSIFGKAEPAADAEKDARQEIRAGALLRAGTDLLIVKDAENGDAVGLLRRQEGFRAGKDTGQVIQTGG